MQLLAGLVWLATLLGALATAFFKWFMDFVTRRYGVALLMIAGVIAAGAAFYAAAYSAVTALGSYSPPELATAVSLVVPTNAPACLTAVFTVHAARLVYSLQSRFLSYKNMGAGF